MPEPGVYLINSTGETVPLKTESGDGDQDLLHEALDELGIEHPNRMVAATFITDMPGSEEPSTPEVEVFRTEHQAGVDSIRAAIRPILEDRYGTVQNLRIQTVHIQDLEGDQDG